MQDKKSPIVFKVSVMETVKAIKPGQSVKFKSSEFAPQTSAASAISRLNDAAGRKEYSISSDDNGATFTVSRAPKPHPSRITAMAAFALAAASLASCSSCADLRPEPSPDWYEVSWSAFCAQRGYDLCDESPEADNEFLDAWRGSCSEEAALIAAGVEPM